LGSFHAARRRAVAELRAASKPEPREQSRDFATGRYEKEARCDACGKPCKPDDFCTDDEVCDGGDGPGFHLCHRKRCPSNKMIGWSVERRREFYTAQRAKNRGETAPAPKAEPGQVNLFGDESEG
jgi:hypothetical protein